MITCRFGTTLGGVPGCHIFGEWRLDVCHGEVIGINATRVRNNWNSCSSGDGRNSERCSQSSCPLHFRLDHVNRSCGDRAVETAVAPHQVPDR